MTPWEISQCDPAALTHNYVHMGLSAFARPISLTVNGLPHEAQNFQKISPPQREISRYVKKNQGLLRMETSGTPPRSVKSLERARKWPR